MKWGVQLSRELMPLLLDEKENRRRKSLLRWQVPLMKITLTFEGEQKMVAYAFYAFEDIEKVHFIGLLPERRKNPNRITQESISQLVRISLGNELDVDNLFFIEITLDQRTGEITQPEPSIRLTPAEA